MKFFIGFLVWVIMTTITFSATFADFSAQLEDYPQLAKKYCRRDMGHALLFAGIPVTWVMVPFMTGFYEHGLKFTCEKSK